MKSTFHSDIALWDAFKKGNRDALDCMFRDYYPMLMGYGLKLYPDKSYIEDSLQNFFLYLYEHRGQLSTPNSIRAYLFKAFRRSLLRQIEKDRTIKNKEKNMRPGLSGFQFAIDELMVKQEVLAVQKNVLLEMLNKLPNRQREVIYLRYYNDLSISDIAEVLSITYQGTVNTLHKAMKTLRMDSRLQMLPKL